MQRMNFWLVVAAIACCQQPASAQNHEGCSERASPNAAIAACTRVIERRGGTTGLENARLARGKAYARKGMNREAIADFSAVLHRAPANEKALLGRAESYLSAREFALAASDYSALITREPKHVTALIGLGYAHLAMNQPKRAINRFSQALRSDARNSVALNNRGLAYKKLGKFDLAIGDFTSAIDFNPLYALAYNNRAYAYEAKGDKHRAISDFRTAITIDPSLAGARDGLVRLGVKGPFVAQASQRVAAGRVVAEKNCAWCHAIGAGGSSPKPQAPPFREIHGRHPILALRAPITRAIATPHDRMPKLPLSDSDVDKIIAYINSLPAQR